MADLIGAGSLGIDQCGPHYFDARAEAVYLTRDETFGPDTVFSHNGLTALIGGEPVFVDIALQSGQLEYDDEPGFRIIGRYDLGPLSVFEFGYMGVFDYSAAATFDDSPGGGNPSPDDLFSIWSLYGNNPLNAEQPAGTDVMRQSEKARTHSISIKSDLQSVEMTYRRYWVGYVPKLSGTVFAGARYTRLSEQFNFFSQGAPNNGSLSYDIDAENQLAGFQTGLDMWVCVTQGLRIGVEGKTGIYNNRYKLDNEITQVQAAVDPNRETILAVFPERFRGDQVAFLSEASVDVVVDVLPSWSIRGGYEVLFMNSLVLAGANFNGGSPYQGFGQPRTAFIENQGKAFFHGIHLGAEYIW